MIKASGFGKPGNSGGRVKYYTIWLLVLLAAGVFLYRLLFSPAPPEPVSTLESQRVYLFQTGDKRVLFRFDSPAIDGDRVYVSYQWRYRQGQIAQAPGKANTALSLNAPGEFTAGPLRLRVRPVPPKQLKLESFSPPGQVSLLPMSSIRYAPFDIVDTSPAWDLTNPRLRRWLFDLRYGDFVPLRIKQKLAPLARTGLPLTGGIAVLLGLAGLFGGYRGLQRAYPRKPERQGVSVLLLLLGVACGWLWQYDSVVHLQTFALVCAGLVVLLVVLRVYRAK